MAESQALEIIEPIRMTTQDKLLRAVAVADNYLYTVNARLEQLKTKGTSEVSLRAFKSIAFFRAAAFLGWTRLEASDDLVHRVVLSEQADDPQGQLSLDVEGFLRDIQTHRLFSPREAVGRVNQYYDWADAEEFKLMADVTRELVDANSKYKPILESPGSVNENGVMRRLKWMEKSVAWAYYRLHIIDSTQSNLEAVQDSRSIDFWSSKIRSAISDFRVQALQAMEDHVHSTYGRKRVGAIIGDNLTLGDTRWNRQIRRLMPDTGSKD